MTADPLAGWRDAPFSTKDALEAGLGRRRVHGKAFDRPFRTVRSATRPERVRDLCRAYLPKMAPHEFFSHRTAAVLHDIWLPLHIEERLMLDVSVHKPRRAPRDARVQGHHLIPRPGLIRVVDGMRVAGPVETICQLATMLGDDDLVVAAESLLTPWHTNRRSTYERMMRAFTDELRPRAARLARVAPRIRMRSRSAQETRVRLLLVASGLPEPAINLGWTSPSGWRAEGDLVYEEERVWIEVEGDHHRTDRRQWRKDVVRYERLTDFGWRVIRVSADDLRLRPEETVARVRRALVRARA